MNRKKEILIRVLSNYIFVDKWKSLFRQNYLKDYSLKSGERQTANKLDDIRKDHLVRYQLALDYIKRNKNGKIKILDMFCGNGYGSYLLASNINECKLTSIDGSKEAVKFAKKFYKNSKDAIKEIESSQEYQNYSFERNY